MLTLDHPIRSEDLPIGGLELPPSQVASEALPTTGVERLLLLATVALMPVFDECGSTFGVSYSLLLFLGLLTFVIVFRFKAMLRAIGHRILPAFAILLTLCFLMETGGGEPRYGGLSRIAQMVAGAALIGTMCRDRRALRIALLGYALVGLWFSSQLIYSMYGNLAQASASSFSEASHVRDQLFAQNEQEVNINRMAFFCSQGCVALLVLTLLSRRRVMRLGKLALASGCALASFLTISRSGALFAIVPCAFILWQLGRGTFRRGVGKGTLLSLLGVGVVVYLLIPEVALVRLSSGSTGAGRTEDSRTRVYAAAWENLGEYCFMGIGEGYYATSWAFEHEIYTYSHGGRMPMGIHNVFLHFWIFWGLPAILALLLVVCQAFRCLPKRDGDEILILAVWALTVGLFLRLMFVHTLHGKEFTLGLGLLIGSSLWIWPRSSGRLGVAESCGGRDSGARRSRHR